MPYILLAIGLLLGTYGFYRFMQRASIHQIKMLLGTVATIAVLIFLTYLVITRRMPLIFLLILPMIYPHLKKMFKRRPAQEKAGSGAGNEGKSNAVASRTEALEILGLEEGANNAEIQSAYKRLIKKIHPDQEGSEWLAAKLNEARDYLLKTKE